MLLGKPSARRVSQAASGSALPVAPPELDSVGEEREDPLFAEPGEAGDNVSRDIAPENSTSDVHHEASAHTLEGSDPGRLAALNRQRQEAAATWLASKPLGMIMSIRLCLKPLVSLLSSHLERSGQSWELQQRAAEARLIGQETGATGRKTALGEYIGLSAEERFFEEVEEMVQSPTWQYLPETNFTLAHQTLIFKMTSRMGSCVEQLLVEPTRCFPLALFRKLQSEEGCVSLMKIQEEMPCVLDEVAEQFLQTFGQQPLTSQAAQAALQLFLSVTSTETVSIEWGHGRVHRLITSLKTQTHVPSMEYINSQFLAQKYVARAQKARAIGKRPPKGKRKLAGAQALGRPLKKAKASSRSGGAYRAFVRGCEMGWRKWGGEKSLFW